MRNFIDIVNLYEAKRGLAPIGEMRAKVFWNPRPIPNRILETEDFEYDPLRFFWFHQQCGFKLFGDEDARDHATFAYEEINKNEDDFDATVYSDEDEEGFQWNNHQIAKAIQNGWVRGRYNKKGYIYA